MVFTFVLGNMLYKSYSAALYITFVIIPISCLTRYEDLTDSIRVEFHDNEGIVSQSRLSSNITDVHFRNRRFTPRPGQATNTHTCDFVRGVPNELRSSAVMKPHGLSNFYQKYTEAYGIPILSSGNVHDNALKRACYLTRFLLADHYGIRNSFYQRSGRTAVIGEHEGTISIPEHSHLGSYMNQRARGLGETDGTPISTGGEENLLCLTNDRYHHEDIFLHEFAHGVANIGAMHVIGSWKQRLESQYNAAKQAGLWANTYSMSTSAEYFAEGVQSYFNVNDYSSTPNGIHGPISTREKLRSYDPALFSLIEEVFPCHNTYLKRCQSTRAEENNQNLKMNCVGGTGSGSTGLVDCSNNNVNCASWARTGECTNNPGYMLVNCQRSCGNCHAATSVNCVDQNQNCHSWAMSGECNRNPAYMLQSCKKSCNKC